VNPPQTSIYNFCRQLNNISLQFGNPYQSKKIKLLNAVPELNKCTAEDIFLLHDTLLAMLAWPENSKLYNVTKKVLGKLISVINERMALEKRLEYRLNGTGIAGSELTGHFSYEITKWLVKEFDQSVILGSWDAKPETIKLFFRQLLPRVEYESIFSGELSPLQRIKKLKGKSTQTDLQWLMMLFEQSQLPDSVKDFLFNELKIFVTWKPDNKTFTRSYLSIPCKKIFYYKKIERTADIRKNLSKKLPLPSLLTKKEKAHMVNVAKATLVFLYRETDPFTFASAEDLKCFDLEKGYKVGLYSLKKEHRLSIESYIGYLVFKNGIPVSYGGGWIFGGRCQFGINILEPFRGGESAYIMSQLIRVYYQYYGTARFVVKPYQFGKNNKEGLESGAFWFYYKLGFRPDDENLQKLAGEEWDKKKAGNNYRTSITTLRKFTSANLQLLLDKNPEPLYDAAIVSKAITRFIISAYDGDRKKAVADCYRKTKLFLGITDHSTWSVSEKKVLEEWGLLAGANLQISAWNIHEKQQFIRLIKSKANNSEPDFIKRLQKHRRFWKDLDGKFA
jgi:hypothetical protein